MAAFLHILFFFGARLERPLAAVFFLCSLRGMPMPSPAPFAPVAWSSPLAPADPPSRRAVPGKAPRLGRARAGQAASSALPRLLREVMLGAVVGILGGWLAGWIASWLFL